LAVGMYRYCCLMPSEQFFSHIMAKTSCISWFRWDDVCFVLDQHTQLDSSLKQQSAGRHITPLVHIILIPSQPVFAHIP
jgi:hypothetical protein